MLAAIFLSFFGDGRWNCELLCPPVRVPRSSCTGGDQHRNRSSVEVHMTRVVSRARNFAIVLGLAAALGGCIVAPAPGPYYGGAYVTFAPPVPRVEYYGVAPYPGYFW